MSTDIKTVLTNNGITLLSNLIANKSKINWSSAYSTSSAVPTTGSSPDIHANLTTLAGWSISNISPRTCSGSVTSANYKKVTSGGNTSEYIEVTCTLYNDPNNNYTGEAYAIGIFIKDENDQDVLLAVAVRDDGSLLHTFSGASGSTDTNDQVYFTCFISLSKSTDITSLNVSLPDTGFYALSSDLNSFKDEIIVWKDNLYKDNGDDPATGEWPTFEASMNTWKDDVDSDLTAWKTGFYDPTEEGSSNPTSMWLKFKKDMIGTWNSWVSDFTGVTTADNQVISGVKTFKPSYTSPASSSETQPTNGVYFVKYDSANTSLIPETDNTCYLGTSAKKFKNVYATTFNGSLEGNASTATYANSSGSASSATDSRNIYVSTSSSSNNYPLVFMSSTTAGSSVSSGNKSLYTDSVNSCYYNPSTNTLTCPTFSGTATKATQDGNGNTITSYYCTLSTSQTISGNKTFSGNISVNSNFISTTKNSYSYKTWSDSGTGSVSSSTTSYSVPTDVTVGGVSQMNNLRSLVAWILASQTSTSYSTESSETAKVGSIRLAAFRRSSSSSTTFSSNMLRGIVSAGNSLMQVALYVTGSSDNYVVKGSPTTAYTLGGGAWICTSPIKSGTINSGEYVIGLFVRIY